MNKEDVIKAITKRMIELDGNIDDLGSDFEEIVRCIYNDTTTMRVKYEDELARYVEKFIVRSKRDGNIWLNF